MADFHLSSLELVEATGTVRQGDTASHSHCKWHNGAAQWRSDKAAPRKDRNQEESHKTCASSVEEVVGPKLVKSLPLEKLHLTVEGCLVVHGPRLLLLTRHFYF